MPRPRDPIWDSFDREPNPNGKIEFAKCRLCDWKQIGLVERLKQHLAKRHPEHADAQQYTAKQPTTDSTQRYHLEPSEIGLQEKVSQLEMTLKKFRAEVDMKMTIVEQVLTTRNELFTVQKKLLDREQALHETVLSHWKNITELAANGLSLKFSDNTAVDIDVDSLYDDESGSSSLVLGKRQAARATLARRERRKRFKLKVASGDRGSEEGGLGEDCDEDPFQEFNNEADITSEQDDDGESSVPKGLEKKVFVKFYSEDEPQPGERITRTPVWKYYLREENGDSALCKLCDDEGIQSILKVRDCSTSSLHTHLKFKHKIVLEPTHAKSQSDGGTAGIDDDGFPLPPKPRGKGGNGNIGRPASQVWSYFTEFILDGQRKQQCLECGQLVSAQAPRLIRHYENCKKKPIDKMGSGLKIQTDPESELSSTEHDHLVEDEEGGDESIV